MRFRRHVVKGFQSHLWVSLAGLLVVVLTDATIVLLSLRFVGVTAADVPALDVYAAFCVLYPLTLFPLAGLGILDGLLLSDLLDVGGSGIEGAAIAALVVWRAVTLGGPIMLGGVCLAAWRLGLVPPRLGTEPAA